MLLNHMDSIGKKLGTAIKNGDRRLAAPISMIKNSKKKPFMLLLFTFGGATETSPIGTVNSFNDYMDSLPLEERHKLQTKQGRPVMAVCS